MKKIGTLTLLAFAYAAHAQAQEFITGSIRSSDGSYISAASIGVKGSSTAVISDSLGQFRVPVQALPAVLRINAIGHFTKEVRIFKSGNPVEVVLQLDPTSLHDIVITSRRRTERLQEVPIPVTVVGGGRIADAGAFNVNRLKELIPTVQLYSSNARNTTLNIRGLGSTYGLTNDGIDPGVGFYVDGVYYARPAATTLDFIDVERVEVLRGPQGTLFGKNTTAGAFNITSKLPEFKAGAVAELSYGNYGYIQAKTSLTGPLIANKLAARVSFSGTQRNGTLYNVHTDSRINDMNNLGFRGQLLFTPNTKLRVVLSGDVTAQKPDGYGWAIAGVVKTQRSNYRQFDTIIKALGYTIPYSSAFDRKVDLDTKSKADNSLGGVTLNADYKIGNGSLTSTSAWRYWKWIPLNDRDYLGIPVFTISSGNSRHKQWSQEFRYSGKINDKLSGVVGLYGLWQDLNTDPVNTEEAGADQWRFQQGSATGLNAYWATPGLLDGYGIKTVYRIRSTSAAAFAQADWAITPKLHILPGIRYNYDKKIANYNRQTYGGLQRTTESDAVWHILDSLKKKVYTDQAFDVNASKGNISGQLAFQYRFNQNLNAYLTYSKSYKPVGVNVGGLPTSNGVVLTNLATVKPESVNYYEFGIKSSPTANTILNFNIYRNDIKNYQTNVQTPEPGVNRGYLANAEKVRVQGFELEGNTRLADFLTVNASLAYTDGKYVKFTNAPLPLEKTGLKNAAGGDSAFLDISGGRLPGISKWSYTVGAEAVQQGKLLGLEGQFFLGADLFYRSEFSSSPTPSAYLNIDGYALLNARLGFRASEGITVLLWSRNLTGKNYYEQLLAAPGNFGQYAGIVGDPRTYGVTLRYTLRH